MHPRCYCAPLEGMTDHIYRQTLHRHFPGADRYFTPFLAPTHDGCFSPRELRQVQPKPDYDLVPQLLTAKSEDFAWAVNFLADLGYEEVNLNLGCPSGTVTAKGKGCGLLADPARLQDFLDGIFAQSPLRISVKTRLGRQSAEEFPALLELFRHYPWSEIVIHPRTGREQYRPGVHLDAYGQALAQLARCGSLLPVCYNGDIRQTADAYDILAAFPATSALMVGRGLIADPALLRKLKGGSAASREELYSFMQELGESYSRAFGSPNTALPRLKELWSLLLESFNDPGRYAKALKKARTFADYQRAMEAVFADLELLPEQSRPRLLPERMEP